MVKPELDINQREVLSDQEPTPRSLVWRILFIILAAIIVLSLLLNLLGISNWILINPLPGEDFSGLTETQIITRFGEPDYRSPIQVFRQGEGFGMLPKRINEGEEFFYLNYTIRTQRYVFHFVSPGIYKARTGQVIFGDEWVVLEYYRGNSFVIY